MKNGKIRSYRDLIAWQKAMSLAEAVYGLTRLLPKEEQFALGTQMWRGAISVPSNIAEGFGRDSRREYVRFLNIARGSVNEIMTQAELAVRVRALTEHQASPTMQLADETAKVVKGLINSLRAKLP